MQREGVFTSMVSLGAMDRALHRDLNSDWEDVMELTTDPFLNHCIRRARVRVAAANARKGMSDQPKRKFVN